MVMDQNKFTKTTVFVLPLLNLQLNRESLLINIEPRSNKYTHNFVNAYLDYNKSEISLVYRDIGNNKRFKELVIYFETLPNHVKTYSKLLFNTPHTIVVFNYPKYVQSNIDCFKCGHYSWIPYEDKIKILNFWNIKSQGSKLHSYLLDKSYKVEKLGFEKIKAPRIIPRSLYYCVLFLI